MSNHFEGWIASLSNGETVFETPPVPGEHSAWQALLRRLKAEGLRITQLRLQHASSTVMAARNMGSVEAQGFVQAYEMRKALFSGKESHYHGVGSVFGDQVFMVWLDGIGNAWGEVRDLSDLRVHSTMDWQAEK
jgi:hypothetical protein